MMAGARTNTVPLRTTWRRIFLFAFVTFIVSPCLVVGKENDSPTDLHEAVEDNEYDEKTLLDTFGAVAKQFLTQRIIPNTDVECKWDWRYVRCEPFCECDFQPRWLDFHLGRSCRLREIQSEGCDPVESVPEAKPIQLMIQRMVQQSQRLARVTRTKSRSSYEKVQNKVCSGLPNFTCSQDLPVLAWQERLFCRHKIPDCSINAEEEIPDQ